LGGDGAVIGRTEEWGGIQFGGDYVVEKKRWMEDVISSLYVTTRSRKKTLKWHQY
jgi:hypothetical protein